MRRTVGVVFILGVMLIAAPTGLSAFSNWASTTQLWTKVENTLINAVYGGIRNFCAETFGHICESMLKEPRYVEIGVPTVFTTIERQNKILSINN